MPNLDPREFDQFMNQARIKCTGASDSGIKAEFYDVCKEFLEDSNAWREDIEFQAVSAQQDYLLVPKYDGQIIRLIGVWDDKGIPIPAYMPTFGKIRLVHTPTTTPTNKWFARVVKNVTVPVTKDSIPIVPDWVLRVYSIHVLDGLLGKLMSQAGKSYTNATQSVYHLRRFRTGIQIARNAAECDNLMGAQQWAFPASARGVGSQRGGVSTAWPTRAF